MVFTWQCTPVVVQSDRFLICHDIYTCGTVDAAFSTSFLGICWWQKVDSTPTVFPAKCLSSHCHVCLLVFMVFLLLLWLFLADNKHLEICIYYTYQHIIWYFCTVCTCIHLDSIQIGPEQVSRSRNLQTMSGPAQIMYEPAVCQQCQNLCKFPENRHAFFCRWIFVKPAQTVFTWGDNRVWREANQHLSLEVCNLCQNSRK